VSAAITGAIMRAHCLQHVSFEGLGSIQPWLAANGYALTHTRFFESVALPDVSAIDLLVIMGGPMSVNEEDKYPWLVAEKRFVREVIESGKPVLGICLGAQMIASAMGASVFPSPVKEIGWYPVHAVDGVDGAVFRFPPSETVFHWHGETFDLPPGAIQLARSAGCENQAFQIGQSVIGMQFHLETTPESAAQLVAHCREELVPSTYVQTAEEILSVRPSVYPSITHRMGVVLAFLGRNKG
jgi:GMP synthase-like glutamine amidotransferase